MKTMRNITKLYLMALTIIGMFSIGSFILSDQQIFNQQSNANIINTSGRQRMLSQRIALLTSKHLQKPEANKQQITESLKKEIALFQKSHQDLLNHKKSQSQDLQTLYFQEPAFLNRQVLAYIINAKAIANNQASPEQKAYFTPETVEKILKDLDQAVSLYEQNSMSALDSFRSLQKISLILSLTVLIMVGALIFKPMVSKIQDQRQALLKAKENAEKIAQIPLNNPNPLIQMALDGQVVYSNPAAKAQYEDLEDLGLKHEAFSDLGDYLNFLKENPNSKKIITREIEYHGVTYHQTVAPTIISGKHVIVIYSYDITAIKKAQEKARLLEAAIANAKDGVIITKADFINPEIIFANDAVTRITGYERNEILGQTPRLFQGPATSEKTLKELKETLMKGRSFKGELLNYTKDGIGYWLDISIFPIRDKNGAITHFAAIERDTTQRKAFEKEMQINREAAEVASRAKGDFLANISHELRTPMNGIIGLSELMTEMNLCEEQLELAGAIHSSSRNLLFLLNDILDLSKIEAKELTLEYIPFKIRRSINQTIDLLRPGASKKGVTLSSTVNTIVPEHIMGDPGRLQQILNNLVSNAIKFTEVGYVRLDITSSRDESGEYTLHIRVEDTGVGIPEEKHSMIFGKFTQADVSTARKFGGTGLGLAITKELVEMMGGRIGFDSIEGRGTTFYADIPVEVAKQETATSQDSTNAPTMTFNTNVKIMAVDDHPVNLLFLRKVLRKLNFTHVDEATSGKEAIELAMKEKYDLIFMDCQMPEIDGFEAATIIREREEKIGDIKIVAVTADAMKGAREKCIDAGMNDYISKPVDVDKLKSVLQRWLPAMIAPENNKGQNGPSKDKSTKNNAESKTAEPKKSLPIIDRQRLEMFTDGDPDEERALFEMFITYAKESLHDLEQALKAKDNEAWRKAAHKFKGSAANLGAVALSDICLKAEKSHKSKNSDKEQILSRIQAAYQEVESLCTTEA